MTDSDSSFRDRAGYVVFPRSTGDLTSTNHCPACFTVLSSQACSSCGLDLSNPLAAGLADVSLDAARALDQRLELIGQIRVESQAAAEAAMASSLLTVDAAVTAPASATPPSPVTTQPAAPAWAAAPPVVTAAAPAWAAIPTTAQPLAPTAGIPAAPTPAATPRRQLSVQVVLLLVGVALLSIGAIFFLVYAFITFGLVWRSLIIGTVTVAAFVGASLLRRRGLSASAESVAILAVVLTYLDSFAVRANNLLVIGDDAGLVHWGATLLITGVGFLVWHRFSGLRVPSVIGFAAIPPGLALLVAGLTEGVDIGIRLFSVAISVAIGALAHPLAGRISRPRSSGRIERGILLVLAIIGLFLASVIGLFIVPDNPAAPAIALLIVAAVCLEHVDVVLRTKAARGFIVVFAALGSMAAASIGAATAARLDNPALIASVPLLAAGVVALALEFGFSRTTAGPARTAWLVGAVAAGIVAACATLVTLGFALRPLTAPFLWLNWQTTPDAPLDVVLEQVLAVAVLAVLLGLIALAWWASGTLRARRSILLWAGVAALIVAVPLTNILWAAVGGWMLLGILGAFLLLVRSSWSLATRLPIAAAAATATTLGYAASWASESLWLVGSLGAIIVLVTARFALTNPFARGGMLAGASVVALVAAGAGGDQLQSAANTVASVHAVAAVAALLLAAGALLARIVALVEARVLFWIPLATATTMGGLLWSGLGSRFPFSLEPVITTLVAFGLGVAVCLWLVLPGTAAMKPERIAASIAIAPVLAWLLSSLTTALAAPPAVIHLAPIVAALLAAGLSLVVPRPSHRWARDIGVAIVAVPALGASAFTSTGVGWLVLMLGAVAALLLAISRDGLFASASGRKHLGWLALALGVASLSWALAVAGVQDVAAYVLPPAAALLVIALLAWNSARRGGQTSAAAPWIGLGGLLVGILPIASTAIAETGVRLAVVTIVSAILLLTGALLTHGMPLRRYLDSLMIAGGAGLLIAAGGRAYRLAIAGEAVAEIALWLTTLFVVFAVAAIGQSRTAERNTSTRVPREIASQALLVIAMLVVLLVESIALRSSTAPSWGALALVLLFAALHVACRLIDRVPFTTVVGWISIGFAGVSWLVGQGLDQLNPLEWASVPIAIALLITGAVALHRSPEARSRAWLAPGILVLILPSLIATFSDRPLWRLVAIGIACLLAIVVGAMLRLQAPLVLGAVLVLVHAIRTFAPQIIAVYQLTQWWVWAVVGGAIIFFIGFTFEKRKRDFQKATSMVAGLR